MKTTFSAICFAAFVCSSCGEKNTASTPEANPASAAQSLKPVEQVDVKPKAEALLGGLYSVQMLETNSESTQPCPVFTLKTTSGAEQSHEQSVCEIKMQGYREFDARKDFAFIAFSGFEISGGKASYLVDMEISQGPAMEARCYLTLDGKTLSLESCEEKE